MSTSVSRINPRVMLSVVVVLLSLPSVAQAWMWIREYQPKLHDRFYGGAGKQFIGQGLDWSGVGKTKEDRWVTMISPSYFLSAAHYRPGDTDTVTFHEGNDKSTPRDYAIAGGTQIKVGEIATDLWLGKLATPLLAEHKINFYPILSLGSDAAYMDRVLFNYGAVDLVGRNVLDGFQSVTDTGSTGLCMLYDYDNHDVVNVGGDETFLIGGDSGAPSFVNWNGELALVGIHWINDTTKHYSGDTFVPNYVGDIGDKMTGDKLTLVPEPSTLALWSLFGMVGGFVAWRRRKQSTP